MRDIRDAICEAGAVCMTPTALARRLGTDEAEAMDLLAELDVAGIVAACDSLDGLVVTLTPLGAERLGLRIVGAGRSRRWQPVADPAPPAVRAAARREDRRCDRAGYPYPTVLLGSGMIWDNVPRDVCPACHNRPLGPHVFCLRCDRWGLDATLPACPREVHRRDRRARPAGSARPDPSSPDPQP